MDILALKRLSGKSKDCRERFKFGASRRDGVRMETLVADEMVGFERRSSGSAGGRTAAEAIFAAASIISNIGFIVTFDEDCRILQMCFLTMFLWGNRWRCCRTSHFELSMKPTKPRERMYSLMVSKYWRWQLRFWC